MERPQMFDMSKGMQGNIENALWENQYRKNEIFNEVSSRKTADTDNRVALEQQATDSYLDLIQAQQNITDLQIQIWELGGN